MNSKRVAVGLPRLVRILIIMKNHLIDEKGNPLVKVGDEVENDDIRFFVGAINESQKLCVLDNGKPWNVKNMQSPMLPALKSGKYAASWDNLTRIQEGEDKEVCCANCRWSSELEERYDQVYCSNPEARESYGNVEAAFSCELFLSNA